MRFTEKMKLLERVDQLIRMKATGTSREFARRLDISKSTVYEIIDVMKDMGAEIEYCTLRKTFYYTSEKVLAIGFVDPLKISGGGNYRVNSLSSMFSDNYFSICKTNFIESINSL